MNMEEASHYTHEPFAQGQHEANIMDNLWLQVENEPCVDCGHTEYVEDTHHGDLICTECGVIKDMKLVDPSAEYRTFQDDDGESESKKRVDGASNPYLRFNFIGTSPKIQDGTEFLREAERDLRNALDVIFEDLRDKGVETIAQDLLQREFHRQCLQKKEKLKQAQQEKGQERRRDVHLGVIKSEKKKRKQQLEVRERFSRRKPFVVACIWWALKERNIPLPHADISKLIDGKEVSHHSLVRCLKDMGVWQQRK